MKKKQQHMASYGGENPWEVAFDEKQAKGIEEANESSNLKDSASEMKDGPGSGTRSFSF